jgi:hypothetical protein
VRTEGVRKRLTARRLSNAWDDSKKHNDGKLSEFNEAGTKSLCKSEIKLLILNYRFQWECSAEKHYLARQMNKT